MARGLVSYTPDQWLALVEGNYATITAKVGKAPPVDQLIQLAQLQAIMYAGAMMSQVRWELRMIRGNIG
jgi:hypothetical protein